MTAGTITNCTTGEQLTLTQFKPGSSGGRDHADIRVLGASNAMWVLLDEWDYKPEEEA